MWSAFHTSSQIYVQIWKFPSSWCQLRIDSHHTVSAFLLKKGFWRFFVPSVFAKLCFHLSVPAVLCVDCFWEWCYIILQPPCAKGMRNMHWQVYVWTHNCPRVAWKIILFTIYQNGEACLLSTHACMTNIASAVVTKAKVVLQTSVFFSCMWCEFFQLCFRDCLEDPLDDFESVKQQLTMVSSLSAAFFPALTAVIDHEVRREFRSCWEVISLCLQLLFLWSVILACWSNWTEDC